MLSLMPSIPRGSINHLQKVESGMDLNTVMYCLRLQRLLWIYCPDCTGARVNEWADRRASTADITTSPQLG